MYSEAVFISLETLKELATDWRQTPTSTIAGVIRFEYSELRRELLYSEMKGENALFDFIRTHEALNSHDELEAFIDVLLSENIFNLNFEELAYDFVKERVDEITINESDYDNEAERLDAYKAECYKQGFCDALEIAERMKEYERMKEKANENATQQP